LRTKTVRTDRQTDTHTDRQTDRHTPMITIPCGLRRAGNNFAIYNIHVQSHTSELCSSADDCCEEAETVSHLRGSSVLVTPVSHQFTY